MDEAAEIRRQMRVNWWNALKELADLPLQHRTWLDTQNTNPHWTFIEFVESFPKADEIYDGERKHYLSAMEARALLDFGDMLLAYKAPRRNVYDHHAILNDPAWEQIVAAAQTALKSLPPES